MKYSVGYQLPDEDDEPLTTIVSEFRDQISEIYFAWWDSPSGRSPVTGSSGLTDYRAQSLMEADLQAFRNMGLRLNLLFNASCYGDSAASMELENRVGSITQHLLESVGLEVITTQSPVIAGLIRKHFPQLEIRASINMRLGTIRALDYVQDMFDSFYVQRELNRDLGYLEEVKTWCEQRGKTMHLLANSGCLANCSAQSFHDNLVSHEKGASHRQPATIQPTTLCRHVLSQPENWVRILQNTWIRPEDVQHYEGIVSQMKLATRMHARPRRVITAYCMETYKGNLLDLLEPGNADCLSQYIIDNSRFPEDWFQQTSSCDKQCHRCNSCSNVLDQVLQKRIL